MNNYVSPKAEMISLVAADIILVSVEDLPPLDDNVDMGETVKTGTPV